MDRLLSAEEMRRIERGAIEIGSVTGLDLMERAGRGVVAAILGTWPDLAVAPAAAAILCGPGNNGGDGYVVARLLHARGWRVEVLAMGDPVRLPADARRNHDRWRALGPVTPLSPESFRHLAARPPALVVDALFGIGLSRPVDLPLGEGLGTARIAAVDVPTGLCAESGRLVGGAGRALAADLTVTFHAPKTGHHLAGGPGLCGRLAVAPIELAEDGRGTALVAGPGRAAEKAGGHKYRSGHVVVLGGGPGKGGAARMAARGALRIGAGLVTIAVPPAALQEYAARLDAIMLRPVRDASALAEMLAADDRLGTVALGPGLGTGPAAREAVEAVLSAGRSAVLDADALTVFADDPETLFAQLHETCVLTPHPGEFARLFPDLAAALTDEPESWPAPTKIDIARAAAARAGCTLLLKGSDTVIASAGGAAAVHSAAYGRDAPWLATAGAGDVLAGIIAGLLARGLSPEEAAAAAAWLHVEAARAFGPGLVAEDLPEILPRVLAAGQAGPAAADGDGPPH